MEPEKRKSPADTSKQPETKKPTAEQGQKAGVQSPAPTYPLVQPIQPPVREPAPQGPENIIEVSDATWEKAVEKEKTPVAVMFYSPTCAFCHQMEPSFRQYAQEYRGAVVFARVNIMANQWIAERYGVRSTPTFKFFCDGKPVQEMVGAVYPALLKRAIDDVLAHGRECAKNSTVIDYEITGYG